MKSRPKGPSIKDVGSLEGGRGVPIDDMGRYDGGRGTKNPISAIQGVKNCRRLLWTAPMSKMIRTLFLV